MVDARKPLPLQLYEAAGAIDDAGQLQMEDLPAFRKAMARFGRGLQVTVRVEEYKSRRSNQANRYYWTVITLISEHTGYEKDELHELFKKRYNPTTVNVGGAEIIGGSTRKLNTKEFYEYVERIRRFAASELDVVTPEPDKREVA